MTVRVAPALFFVLLAASGCDAIRYEPDGENVVDVPEAGSATIDLESAPPTVVLWGNAVLRYSIDAPGALVEVRVYLGDRLVATTESTELVVVPTRTLADGSYRLRVVAVASAGTGSLGDRLGRETVETVAERTAILDNAAPRRPTVTFRVEDGFLEVRWTESQRPSFDLYEVYREGELVATITDRATASWKDPGYAGGARRYRVGVRAGGVQVEGEALASYPAPAVQSAVATEAGVVRVAWTETLFPGAFRRYELYRTTDASPDIVEAAVVDTPGDTVVIDRAAYDLFGTQYEYSLRTEPTSDPFPSTAPVRTWAEPDLGFMPTAFVSGRLIGPGRAEDGARALVAVDATTLEDRAIVRTETDSLRAASSPSGAWLVSTGASSAEAAASVVVRDPVTLAPIRTVRLASPGRVGDQVQVTDDGLLYFSYWEQRGPTAQYGLGVGVIDLATGAVEERIGEDGAGRLIGATADGRYVLVGVGTSPVLYERTEPGTYVPRVETYGLVLADALLTTTDGDLATVRRLPDLSVIRSFAIDPRLGELEYDAASGLVYGLAVSEEDAGRDAAVIAYDPETGTEAGRLALDPRAGGAWTQPRFVDGRVWWERRARSIPGTGRRAF